MINRTRLLRGKSVEIIGLCKVHPLTLGEIDDLGEEMYNHHLNNILLDKKYFSHFISPEMIEQFEKLSIYEYYIYFSYHQKEFSDMITTSLEVFLKEKVTYNDVENYFFVGKENKIINSNSFELIREIIKQQNYLSDKKDEKEFKPANDKARELIEKRKKIKEKLTQQNKDEGLNLSDMISIVSAYSDGINILNVWDLTIYQLYESYIRLLMWDDYHSKHLLLPHVTDQKALDLKHWATKINLNNFKEE